MEIPNDETEELNAQGEMDQKQSETEETKTDQKEGQNDNPNVVTGPDPLINATIYLPKGDCTELAMVKNQKWNADGLLIG